MAKRFRTRVQRHHERMPRYIVVPFSVERTWGTRGRVPVSGTLAGVGFRRAVLPMGDGTHFMNVPKDLCEAAGIDTGDTVSVIMDRDDEPRPVEVPDELDRALGRGKRVRAVFDALPAAHRRECAGYVAEAKKPETRERRARRVVDSLLGRC